MKSQSAKAKGRRAQQEVRDAILALRGDLTEDDVRSTSMGASGEDLLLSSLARRIFPIASEVKNTERINIWQAIAQAQEHAKEGVTPVVFFRRNRSEMMACVPATELLSLYSQLYDLTHGGTET